MAFLVSPGVNVSEIDVTAGVQNVSLSSAGFAGPFQWGPALDVINVGSEQDLVQTFGKPDANTATYWFSAASFLAYSNQLKVVRAIASTALNATPEAKTATGVTATVTNGSTTVTLSAGTANAELVAGRTILINGTSRVIDSVTNATSLELTTVWATANASGATIKYYGTLIKNESDWDANYSTGISGYGMVAAKWAGELGNSLKISMCPSANAFTTDATGLSGNVVFSAGNTTVVGTGTAFNTELVIGDYITAGGVKVQVAAVANATSLTLMDAPTTNVTTTDAWTREWEYAYLFDAAPGTSAFASNRSGVTDELHLVIVDENGLFSGVPGTVLEKYAFASKASDGRDGNGVNNYYVNLLNRNSAYVWWLAHDSVTSTTNWGGTTAGTTFAADVLPLTESFVGGTSHNSTFASGTGAGALMTAYDLFENTDVYDVSLLVSGPAIVRANSSTTDTSVASHLVSLAESRKDCVVFLSPAANSVINQATNEVGLILADRTTFNSSYAFMDSGWKYTYDKYNDVYRWVPLNGDIAGLAARTDTTNDPWFSPAGLTRGVIKNVVKLAWNPKQADRDDLYKVGVNPVVAFPGQGVLLYGDKTLLTRPSAFDRINVRRLFITLEKTIARYAKSQLFEFNDEFTRAAFRNAVEPFLRDVKARRGITDYLLVCDGTNNTADVIDNNQFVGDIFVKPTRSINFIQLNFVAVRSNVAFQEIVGGVA